MCQKRTPLYMSPEQCKSAKRVTGQSDVYSLGVMLYQLLTGAPPFSANNAGDLIAMHLNDAPPPLTALEIPSGLAELVMRMLGKTPESRPTMAEASARLRELSGDGPLLQAPRPVTPRRPANRAVQAATVVEKERPTIRTPPDTPANTPANTPADVRRDPAPDWNDITLRKGDSEAAPGLGRLAPILAVGAFCLGLLLWFLFAG